MRTAFAICALLIAARISSAANGMILTCTNLSGTIFTAPGGIKDDIRVPLSLPMVRELKRARSVAVEGSPYVFPGRYAGSRIAKFGPAMRQDQRRVSHRIVQLLGIKL